MVKANAIDLPTSGVVGFNGTGFVGSPATQYAVLTAGATSSSITAVGPGTSGQILQSGGNAASPTYSTATYPSTATGSGKALISDGTNWVASTPTYPNAASTAGKAVISDGTNFVTSTPTFPNASATSRKIIMSDGTNWTASTETFAAPTTNGNLLTSNGTNWASSAPASVIYKNLTVTIPNSDLKSGASTLIIPAQGAGTVIVAYSAVWQLIYGGSNAFTNIPLDRLSYGSTYTTGRIFDGPGGASFWQATTNFYAYQLFQQTTTLANSLVENTALYNTMSTAATGNASNDNIIKVNVLYYVITL